MRNRYCVPRILGVEKHEVELDGGSDILGISGGTFVFEAVAMGAPGGPENDNDAINVTGGTDSNVTFKGDVGYANATTGRRVSVTVDDAVLRDMDDNPTVTFAATENLKRLELQNSATVRLDRNANNDHTTIIASQLAIAEDENNVPTARLDINDGFLAINYDGDSPLEDVVAWIKSGFKDVEHAWDGQGIISSAAALDPGAYAVGWAEASVIQPLQYVPFGPDHPFGDFEDIDGTTILVRYTLVGDINLDGTVDDIDISILTGNYLSPGTWGWADGDVFGYDGVVDDPDVGLQAGNYGMSV